MDHSKQGDWKNMMNSDPPVLALELRQYNFKHLIQASPWAIWITSLRPSAMLSLRNTGENGMLCKLLVLALMLILMLMFHMETWYRVGVLLVLPGGRGPGTRSLGIS